MSILNLIDYIEALRRRVDALPEPSSVTAAERSQLVDTIEQLSVAVEEIQVAEEELRQQHEELLSTQNSLESEQRRYRDLFDFAPDAYLVTSASGVILEVNRAAAELLGREPEHLLQRPLANFVVEADRPTFRSRLPRQDQPSGTVVGSFETTFLRFGEGTLRGAVTWGPVLAADGTVAALRWLVRDVTTRWEAQRTIERLNSELEQRVQDRTAELEQRIAEQLRVQRRLEIQFAAARALADSSSLDEAAVRVLQAVCEGLGWEYGALWRLEDDPPVLRTVAIWRTAEIASPMAAFEAATRSLAYPSGIGLPGHVLEAGSPLWLADITVDESFPRNALALAAGLHGALAIPIFRGEQMIAVLESFSYAIQEPDEELLESLVAVGRQIGSFIVRLEAEERLRLSHGQLSVIMEGVADGITAQDRSGRLIYANSAGARLSGFATPEEMLAEPPGAIAERFEIFDEDGRTIPREKLGGRQALLGVLTPPMTVRYRVRASGEERWAITTSRPVFNADGEVEMVVNIFHDVTDLKQREVQQRVLAEAGRLLASTLDYEERLRGLAQLAVPHLADWCAVDLVQDDGSIRQVALVHVDPARIQLALELREQYPPEPDAEGGTARVIRTGLSEYTPSITDEMIEAAVEDLDLREVLKTLHIRSSIVAPLTAHGRTFGAVSFVWAESGRRYSMSDVAVAEEIGHRAALAIDNARLYEESRRLNADLEARVARRTAQLEAVNDMLRNEIGERMRTQADLLETQRRLADSREAERLMLAQELHDGPTQGLYGLSYQLGRLAEEPDEAVRREQLAVLQDSLRAVTQSLRTICGELRPPALTPFGLETAIRSHVERFGEQYPDLAISLQLVPDRQTVPEPVRLALYRIFQEALSNIARHAEATTATVSFRADSALARLVVADDGRGFDVPERWLELARAGHLGLVGALERAEAVGGRLDVQSQPGEGTRIEATVPLGVAPTQPARGPASLPRGAGEGTVEAGAD